MKKFELFFSVLLIPVDFGMIVLAGILAYNLRFFSFFTEIRPVFYELPFQNYLVVLLLAAAIFVLVFAMAGLYSTRVRRRIIDELLTVVVANTAAIALVIVVIFFQRELFSSRFIVLSGWALAVFTVAAGRLLVRIAEVILQKRGVGLHNVVVIGADKTSADLVKQMYQHPTLGYRMIERHDIFDAAAQQSLAHKVAAVTIDEIIQGDSTLPRDQVMAIRNFCNDHNIIYKYATDLFEVQPTHIEINTIAGIPVIEVRRTKLDGWGAITKRVIDIFLSSVLITLLSPLFALVALLIVIDSQGGILARLQRVGYRGRTFTLYKFRSMVRNAHALKKDLAQLNERSDGPLFKIKDDPRVTRVGRLLRKTSIDELPQLFNVLKGEMSLVGPRPHEPEEVARYERWHRKLLDIKPGMTGLAQVSGRSDLKFEDEAKLDVYYIENWSPKLDIQILLKTPLVVLFGRNAS